MLTCVAQLPAFSLATVAALLPVAPAGSSSLQTELVLILTCPAQARTILRIGRSWKRHEKQTRRRYSNNRPIIMHVTCLSFSHRDNKIVRLWCLRERAARFGGAKPNRPPAKPPPYGCVFDQVTLPPAMPGHFNLRESYLFAAQSVILSMTVLASASEL
jgi:hypothetical protein